MSNKEIHILIFTNLDDTGKEENFMFMFIFNCLCYRVGRAYII